MRTFKQIETAIQEGVAPLPCIVTSGSREVISFRVYSKDGEALLRFVSSSRWTFRSGPGLATIVSAVRARLLHNCHVLHHLHGSQ